MRLLAISAFALLLACATSSAREPDLAYGPDDEVLRRGSGWAMDDYGFFLPVSDHCLVVRVGDYSTRGAEVVLEAPSDSWRISGSVAETSCDDAMIAWGGLMRPSDYVGAAVALQGRFSIELVTISPTEAYLRLSGELTYVEPWDGGVPRTVVLDRAIAWVLRPSM